MNIWNWITDFLVPLYPTKYYYCTYVFSDMEEKTAFCVTGVYAKRLRVFEIRHLLHQQMGRDVVVLGLTRISSREFNSMNAIIADLKQKEEQRRKIAELGHKH